MADAATAPATATPTPPPVPAKQAFRFHGAIGTPFTIEGKGFGAKPTEVHIGGRAIRPTAWSDVRVKGVVPEDLPTGLTEIAVGEQKIKVMFNVRELTPWRE